MAEQVVVEFSGDASGLKPLADALKALGQLTDEQIKAFNDATKAAENFGQKSSKATKETEKSAEELNKSFKEFQEGIIGGATEEFAKQMKGIGLEATKTTETSKRLTTQLRDLKNQLATLPEGSKEFKKVAIEAAKLEDKIGDVSKEVRILASDSLALDTMTGIARGIAGGFALAQGAAALFGKENEDVQKALLKVNAAMAILQGLQEVSLVLRKEEVVRVGLAAAANKLYTFAVNTSTAALATFISVGTLGLAALVAAVVFLTRNWDFLTDAIKSADEIQDEFLAKRQADFQKTIDRQKQESAEVENSANKKIAAMKNELAISKAMGEDKQKIFEQEQAIRQAELELLEVKIREEEVAKKTLKEQLRRQEVFFGTYQKGSEQQKEALKEIEDLRKSVAATETNLTNAQIALSNKQTELRIADIERQTDVELQAIEDRKRAAERAENEKGIGALPLQTPENIETSEQIDSDALERGLERRRRVAEKVAALEEEERQKAIKAEEEKQQAIADASITIAQETFDTIFAITSERRNAEYEAELAALEKEKEAKLANKKLTDGQRAAIEAQYRKKEAKIKEEQFKKDKAAAIVQALINGALAIATTIAKLGAPPSPAGIAGLAAVAASTALSVASIAAQPIPKFAKGTKNAPEGLALVGEQGAELVHLPQGAKVIPHPASMKILDGHIDSEKILSDYNIKTGGGTLNIDYQKLASELGKELGKHPKTTINVDENGLRVFIQSENHRVERLEKRYASK